ncbi:MAG: 4'-phosphopantetheinyl transferase superfamily protein [Bdellovibrionota bacterium]
MLDANHVHLWKVFLTEDELCIRQLEQSLSQHELDRANAFHNKKDRSCFITARSILKKILSKYTNIPIHKIILSYSEFGKPYLASEENVLPIQFSVTHSNNVIVLAFTLESPIGVDIEQLSPIPDFDSIAKIVFSEIEYDTWSNISFENKLQFFYQLWTYKESVIKALGYGFSYDTKKFTITETTKKPTIIFHDSSQKANLWTIEKIFVDDMYCAAFATQQLTPKVHYFEYCLDASAFNCVKN